MFNPKVAVLETILKNPFLNRLTDGTDKHTHMHNTLRGVANMKISCQVVSLPPHVFSVPSSGVQVGMWAGLGKAVLENKKDYGILTMFYNIPGSVSLLSPQGTKKR